jgi:exopolysaccharide production protein ExoY
VAIVSKALRSQGIALVLPAEQAVLATYSDIARLSIKSAIDTCGALVGLFFLWPLLVGIIVTIRITDGGPAIFAQQRIGRNGRPFRCLKFRTMVRDADRALQSHLASSPLARREWQDHQKLTVDPRITAIGAFLRRTSLDELPQLFNILCGQMSFVGPRPIVPDEIHRYGEHFSYCFSVMPGLTGLWQVSGRSDCGYDKRIALDRRYVTRWSLRLDAEILIKTIPAVLRQQGSR